MFVSVEKIPPMVSHIACVCVGLLLSFYLRSDRGANECFLPGNLTLAFPNKYFSNESAIPLPGKKVRFVKSHPQKNSCAVKNISAIVIQNEPFPVAAFPFKSAHLVSELLRLKDKERMVLVSDSAMDSFPTCSDTRIQYGH